LPKIEDRINVVAYLNQAGGAPVELTPPDGAAAAPAATETAAATTETAPAVTGTAPAAGTTAAVTTETAPAPTATETSAATTDTAAAATPGSGDAANGEKVFKKCRACHQAVEGKNGVGPSLWGVVGRAVASVEGFNYSDAMLSRGGTWDFAALNAFLTDPKGTVPGTKMSFPGLKSEQDRLDVITYLNEIDGTPVPLQ
jgi:cytochrome c2